MPGMPGNAGFPSMGIPEDILCSLIPMVCNTNNPESGGPYPLWFYPPIIVNVLASASQTPQTPQHQTQPQQEQKLKPAFCSVLEGMGIGETAAGIGVQTILGMGWVGEATLAGAMLSGAGWGLVVGGAMVGIVWYHYCE